ncbi:hypothetical protein V2J56_09035 [Georgenia sp. MJ206]|uniref:hypothetical protein n=1 Tax=Georgenia wangjunii TaxID=3117730 RepID=UPI002F265C86
MSAPEGFNGAPEFALGTVRGLRSFTIGESGSLHGVTYPQEWEVGENAARCPLARLDPRAPSPFVLHAHPMLAWGASANFMYLQYARGGVHALFDERSVEGLPATPADHDMSKCACGFYAYFDDTNEYGATDRAAAVVEGYGQTIIGTKGFRSAKARILALVLPTEPEPEAPPVLEDWRRGWEDRVWWWASLAAIWMAALLMNTRSLIVDGPHWLPASVAALDLAIIAWAAWNVRDIHRAQAIADQADGETTDFRMIPARSGRTRRQQRAATALVAYRIARAHASIQSFARHMYGLAGHPARPKVTPEILAQVRDRYADVQFFPDVPSMLAAFPTARAHQPALADGGDPT